MGETFFKAEKVVAWLCSPVSSSFAHSKDVNADACWLLNQAVRGLGDSAVGRQYLDVPANVLVRLLTHEYWSRLWTIQELRLARQVELL